MPRVGPIYTLPPGYLAVLGEIIDPSQHNPPLEDIAQALTDSLPRNGTGPMTGALAMGSNKITGLATGTNPSDAVRLDQVTSSAFLSSVSALSLLADEMVYANGVNTAAKTSLTAFARTLLDDANAAAALTTLGAQPLDADLTAIAALTPSDGDTIVRAGGVWTAGASGSAYYLAITASTTWNRPAGYSNDTMVTIDVWGAGGGGAGASSLRAGGGGAGGGFVRRRMRYADVPTSVTVTIGAAGTAGASGVNNGGAGGNTTFGSLVTAYGGGRGAASPSNGLGGGGGGAGGPFGAGGNASGGTAGTGLNGIAGGAGSVSNATDGSDGASSLFENVGAGAGGGGGNNGTSGVYNGGAAGGAVSGGGGGGGGAGRSGSGGSGGVSVLGGAGGAGGVGGGAGTAGTAPGGGGGGGDSNGGSAGGAGGRGEIRIWIG